MCYQSVFHEWRISYVIYLSTIKKRLKSEKESMKQYSTKRNNNWRSIKLTSDKEKTIEWDAHVRFLIGVSFKYLLNIKKKEMKCMGKGENFYNFEIIEDIRRE